MPAALGTCKPSDIIRGHGVLPIGFAGDYSTALFGMRRNAVRCHPGFHVVTVRPPNLARSEPESNLADELWKMAGASPEGWGCFRLAVLEALFLALLSSMAFSSWLVS